MAIQNTLDGQIFGYASPNLPENVTRETPNRALTQRRWGFCGLFGVVAGVADHIVPFDNLFAFAALRFAQAALGGIQLMPTLPRGVGNVFRLQEFDHRVLVRLRRGLQYAGGPVAEQDIGGFLRVRLGVADQAHRPALNPAGGVQARDSGAGFGIDEKRCSSIS